MHQRRDVRPSTGPELVLAGNLLVDDLVFADGRTLMGEAGGAMLYAALGASLWGIRVGIVSVAGSDYPDAALAALAARGVDLGGVTKLASPGLRTWLLYEPHGRRVIHQLGRPSHLEVSPKPDQIPAAYATARAFHLAPMPLEGQRELASHLARREDVLISVDPYETVTERTVGAWREVLSGIDGFFPSEDELLTEGAGRDAVAALRRLGGGRLRWVAFKRGARGGIFYESGHDRATEWEALGGQAVDSTGAGDAFAGGFLAGLIAGCGLESALEQGRISASFAIEDWGARGLLAATPARAAERRHARFGAPS